MDDIRKDLERVASRPSPALFGLGHIEVSDHALQALLRAYSGNPDSVAPFLLSHSRGDWPELTDHEREMNASALEGGHQIIARYTLPSPQGQQPHQLHEAIAEAIAVCTEAEISPGHRTRTTVTLAQVVDFHVQAIAYEPRFPKDQGYYIRIVRKGSSGPRGYTKETGPFPSPEAAMDAFARAKRRGPWPLWNFRIRFYDFVTEELLRGG